MSSNNQKIISSSLFYKKKNLTKDSQCNCIVIPHEINNEPIEQVSISNFFLINLKIIAIIDLIKNNLLEQNNELIRPHITEAITTVPKEEFVCHALDDENGKNYFKEEIYISNIILVLNDLYFSTTQCKIYYYNELH